jgi:ABC-2 type transport system permease protein
MTARTARKELTEIAVSRREWIRGKALGIAAALALLLIPAILIGAAALTIASEFGDLNDDVSPFWLLALVFGIYFALFVAASLGVSARAKSSRARGW